MMRMVEFKITFRLDEPFGPLEKMVKEAITEGKEYGYPNESIIEMALSEYDVFIYCQGKEIFNATVNFNEFLYELFRFAFYTITGEVPKNMKSYGWSFNSLEELPDWLYEEIKVLKQLLGQEFTELTSKLFLRSFLGSYDPTVVVYAFKKDGYVYFVNIDYRKVCNLPLGNS
ncbi:hypothetical protein [Thermococcus sp. Bubb.Bath]|uniref:hypothetical protein n=1 Tax=Thermococcus sp. Bubb.Bath TaxID=1638242 RepID=UPI001F107458|nr:hypothetical protein [Thermococcus sp. Bubb.Bath]